jgi:hypothetical protein
MGGDAISFGELRLSKGRSEASGDPASILTKSLTLSLAFRPCRDRDRFASGLRFALRRKIMLHCNKNSAIGLVDNEAPVSGSEGEDRHGQCPV